MATTDQYFLSDSTEHSNEKFGCQNAVTNMQIFNRSYMTFLISVGLFGNFVTIIVFMATKLRHVPSSHYLTALAAADAGVLACSLLALLGRSTYPNLLIGACQLMIYANNVFACLSVWYVVGFTIERFIAVRYPLARLRWCTIRRTRKIIFGTTFVAIFYYVYSFIFVRVQIRSKYKIEEGTKIETDTDLDIDWQNDTVCDVLPKYYQLALTFNYVDSVLTLILPLFLIVGFNASIVLKLLFTDDGRRRSSLPSSATDETILSLKNNDSSSKSRRASNLSDRDEHSTQKSTLIQASVSTACGSIVAIDLRRHGGSTKRVDERVTRLLFIISSAFIIMNMPDHIVRMIIFALYESGRWSEMSLEIRCHFELCQQMTNTIFYTYFAVNFVLYNVVGVNFRRELKILLKRLTDFVCELFSKNKRDREFSLTTISSVSRRSITSNRIGHHRSIDIDERRRLKRPLENQISDQSIKGHRISSSKIDS